MHERLRRLTTSMRQERLLALQQNMNLPFQLLNVFALPGRPWTGNALAVFTECAGLDEATMRAIARQMNLAEVTFVEMVSGSQVSANVRIFTVSVEMSFAGHPTLGTAHVVHAMQGRQGDSVALQMKAGLVHVRRVGESAWQLRAAKHASWTPTASGREGMAKVLGLAVSEIQGVPMWVDTGTEQLIVPLRDAESVRRVTIDAGAMGELAYSDVAGEAIVYVIGPREDGDLEARFFTLSQGAILEDAATGSACVNYGGYLSLACATPLPFEAIIHQGSHVGRPSRLGLHVTREDVFVCGEVAHVGHGMLHIEI